MRVSAITISTFTILNLVFGTFPLLAVQEQDSENEAGKRSVIVVTANRIETDVDKVASSSTVIEVSQEVSQSHQTVGDLLGSIEGVEVLRQGGMGASSSLFIRGTNSEHTLVLIDGVEVNDPASPTRSFDFSHLSLDEISRVEIVKGPQSTLYGSDALGGVINIITKQGAGPLKRFVELELGSFETERVKFGLSSGQGNIRYNISATGLVTEGFSSANSADGNGERDGHRQLGFFAKINSNVSDRTDLELVMKYSHADTDYDRGGGPGKDDPNLKGISEQIVSRLKGRFFALGDRLESTVAANFSQTRRESKNKVDSVSPIIVDDFFKGDQLKLEAQSNYSFSEKKVLSVGGSYEEEEAETNSIDRVKVDSKGLYLQFRGEWKQIFLTVGARRDQHSISSVEATTYRIAPGIDIQSTGTQLVGSLGTGFKSPSLYSLFDPTYGSSDLKAEQVRSWDLGIRQKFFSNNRIAASLTYFENDFENLLSFDPATFKAINLGESSIRGIEFKVLFQISKVLKLSLNNTHLIEFENVMTGKDLVRRPKNSWSGLLSYVPNSKWSFSSEFKYVGDRSDYDATTFSEIISPSHEILSVNGQYNWSQTRQFFMKVQNVLDKQYEEVDGYGASRLAIRVGARLEI